MQSGQRTTHELRLNNRHGLRLAKDAQTSQKEFRNGLVLEQKDPDFTTSGLGLFSAFLLTTYIGFSMLPQADAAAATPERTEPDPQPRVSSSREVRGGTTTPTPTTRLARPSTRNVAAAAATAASASAAQSSSDTSSATRRRRLRNKVKSRGSDRMSDPANELVLLDPCSLPPPRSCPVPTSRFSHQTPTLFLDIEFYTTQHLNALISIDSELTNLVAQQNRLTRIELYNRVKGLWIRGRETDKFLYPVSGFDEILIPSKELLHQLSLKKKQIKALQDKLYQHFEKLFPYLKDEFEKDKDKAFDTDDPTKLFFVLSFNQDFSKYLGMYAINGKINLLTYFYKNRNELKINFSHKFNGKTLLELAQENNQQEVIQFFYDNEIFPRPRSQSRPALHIPPKSRPNNDAWLPSDTVIRDSTGFINFNLSGFLRSLKESGVILGVLAGIKILLDYRDSIKTTLTHYGKKIGCFRRKTPQALPQPDVDVRLDCKDHKPDDQKTPPSKGDESKSKEVGNDRSVAPPASTPSVSSTPVVAAPPPSVRHVALVQDSDAADIRKKALKAIEDGQAKNEAKAKRTRLAKEAEQRKADEKRKAQEEAKAKEIAHKEAEREKLAAEKHERWMAAREEAKRLRQQEAEQKTKKDTEKDIKHSVIFSVSAIPNPSPAELAKRRRNVLLDAAHHHAKAIGQLYHEENEKKFQSSQSSHTLIRVRQLAAMYHLEQHYLARKLLDEKFGGKEGKDPLGHQEVALRRNTLIHLGTESDEIFAAQIAHSSAETISQMQQLYQNHAVRRPEKKMDELKKYFKEEKLDPRVDAPIHQLPQNDENTISPSTCYNWLRFSMIPCINTVAAIDDPELQETKRAALLMLLSLCGEIFRFLPANHRDSDLKTCQNFMFKCAELVRRKTGHDVDMDNFKEIKISPLLSAARKITHAQIDFKEHTEFHLKVRNEEAAVEQAVRLISGGR